MKKPTETQRKLLQNAEAGRAIHMPKGRSESGGWGWAHLACRRNGWMAEDGTITEAGKAALAQGKPK